MEITPKWDFVEGSFDTENTKMICVPSKKNGTVELCLKDPECGWNFPFAEIKLHSEASYKDFEATYDDAVKFGKEIARRWNECETKR